MIVTFNKLNFGDIQVFDSDEIKPSFISSDTGFFRVPNNLKGQELLVANKKSLRVSNGYLEQYNAPMFTFNEIRDFLTLIFTKVASERIPSNTEYCLNIARLLIEGINVGIEVSYPVFLLSHIDGSLLRVSNYSELTQVYKQLITDRLTEANSLMTEFGGIGRAILSAKSQVELNSIGV